MVREIHPISISTRFHLPTPRQRSSKQSTRHHLRKPHILFIFFLSFSLSCSWIDPRCGPGSMIDKVRYSCRCFATLPASRQSGAGWGIAGLVKRLGTVSVSAGLFLEPQIFVLQNHLRWLVLSMWLCEWRGWCSTSYLGRPPFAPILEGEAHWSCGVNVVLGKTCKVYGITGSLGDALSTDRKFAYRG